MERQSICFTEQVKTGRIRSGRLLFNLSPAMRLLGLRYRQICCAGCMVFVFGRDVGVGNRKPPLLAQRFFVVRIIAEFRFKKNCNLNLQAML